MDPHTIFYTLYRLFEKDRQLSENAEMYNGNLSHCVYEIEDRDEALKEFSKALEDYVNLKIDERLKK